MYFSVKLSTWLSYNRLRFSPLRLLAPSGRGTTLNTRRLGSSQRIKGLGVDIHEIRRHGRSRGRRNDGGSTFGISLGDQRYRRGEHNLKWERDEVALRIEPFRERALELDLAGLATFWRDFHGDAVCWFVL
ncbi:hypothetical protein RRF57_008790 [Xylaria bambusicola]|uniref:Uncharacterized protein n=1 Tax=Xylaria bambusicola TaxID=326684 RepID=A0AAN7UUI1_9PEZI